MDRIISIGPNQQEKIGKIIDKLREHISARVVIVVSRDGVLMSASPKDYHFDNLDETVKKFATAFIASELAELNIGNNVPESVLVSTKDKTGFDEQTLIISAGRSAILIVKALNFILHSIPSAQKAGKEINEVLIA